MIIFKYTGEFNKPHIIMFHLLFSSIFIQTKDVILIDYELRRKKKIQIKKNGRNVYRAIQQRSIG